MVELISVRGTKWGPQLPPRDKVLSISSKPIGKPWIRALSRVRTLGISVLNKSPPIWALQPQLTGYGSDHACAPESWEPVVLTQQWYNFPSQGAFQGGFHSYTGTGEALHLTTAYIFWDWLYKKWGNWLHQISKLKTHFGNTSDLSSESLLRATNLKATIYWAYRSTRVC